MQRKRVVALWLLAAMCGLAEAASFYKWVDDKGVTHYSAEPPPPGRNGNTLDVDPNHNVTPFAPAPDLGEMPVAQGRQKRVVMYSAEWCGVCKQARRYFTENGVRFTEHDIDKSEKGRADYRRLGGRGVPLILVGDQRMSGFSAGRFEKMLKQ